ncbi:MAG: hypothetical protein LBM02_06585 [Lachnospiraceae bacterium]|jgi:hypothetical protein|nr:hypothetical protein [Lachnospiraceae bacterium]
MSGRKINFSGITTDYLRKDIITPLPVYPQNPDTSFDRITPTSTYKHTGAY